MRPEGGEGRGSRQETDSTKALRQDRWCFRNSREGYVARTEKVGDEVGEEGRGWILEGLKAEWRVWILF